MISSSPIEDPRVPELEAEIERLRRLLDFMSSSALVSILTRKGLRPPDKVDAAMVAAMKGREQEIRAELKRAAALCGWHAAVKLYADPPPEKSAEEWEEEEEDKIPYCRECGNERMIYLAKYANGTRYKCDVCGDESLW